MLHSYCNTPGLERIAPARLRPERSAPDFLRFVFVAPASQLARRARRFLLVILAAQGPCHTAQNGPVLLSATLCPISADGVPPVPPCSAKSLSGVSLSQGGTRSQEGLRVLKNGPCRCHATRQRHPQALKGCLPSVPAKSSQNPSAEDPGND